MSLKRKAVDLAAAEAKKPKGNGTITSFFGAPKPSSSPAVAKTSSSIVSSSPPAASNTTTTTTTTTTDASKPLANPVFAAAAGVAVAPNTDASTTTITATPKFDKQKWVDSLTPEQKELLKLEIATLHESWLGALKDELTTKSFLDLKRFLKAEALAGKTIYPPSEDVYSWSRHTPLPTVKVVLLGQDPYHGPSQAHGLCFSVRPPTRPPPSLRNIFTTLKKQYPTTFSPPPHNGGLLTPWADRGVLMLNTCLTVQASRANSHAGKGWERFTGKVLEVVERRRSTAGVVFLAWGKPAQERCKGVDRKRHCVLSSVHPSPLAAHKGFFDCGHFVKANEWLKERYGDEGQIDWNLDVAPEDAGV